jgi:hypothetical protein
MFRYIVSFCVAAVLSLTALYRGYFSLQAISSEMSEVQQEVASEILKDLDQPYYFLGKGRQSFAFVSLDGKKVLKFFNQKYHQMPWYTFILPDKGKEFAKRSKREFFYHNSYCVAEKFLQKQTGLLYVHLGKTNKLPRVMVLDATSKWHSINLNDVPFVLQRKGDPFYPSLQQIQKREGNDAMLSVLDDFLEMISLRISLGIGDGDHDIEHNFGILDGKPFHLDPGRLFSLKTMDKEELSHQWWVATHSLRKWLKNEYPDLVAAFDQKVLLKKSKFQLYDSTL